MIWNPCKLSNIWNDEDFIKAWLIWGAAPASDQLNPFKVGDSFEVVLNFSIPTIEANPVGRTLTLGWLTIKSVPTAADPTANAAWTATGGQLKITTTDTPGIGRIINPDAGGARLRFDITPANSAALNPHRTYYYDVQVKLNDNAIYTIEQGVFDTLQPITVATS